MSTSLTLTLTKKINTFISEFEKLEWASFVSKNKMIIIKTFRNKSNKNIFIDIYVSQK